MAPPFFNERQMQRYYAENLHLLDPSLLLLGRDPSIALEFELGKLRADMLAVSEDGCLVVVEFKIGNGDRCALGQLLTYMALARRSFQRRVCGVLVARWVDEAVRIAAADLGDISVFEFFPDKRLVRVEPPRQ
jgi:RecB family endonuclease NucS